MHSTGKEIPKKGEAQEGFSLIELLTVVAIIGILAAIAFPSYSRYVVKSNRSAAESFMLGVANKEEQYILDARQYFSTSGGCANVVTLASVGLTLPNEVSPNYTVNVCANNAATPPSYTITAVPIGAQATRDTQCASVTLDQAGTKGKTGTGQVSDCW